jgi:hypothetical protein
MASRSSSILLGGAILLAGLVSAAASPYPEKRPPALREQKPPSPPPTAAQTEKATCGDKYANLLRTIHVPGDVATYGEFHDWGKWSGTAYAGEKNIPPGYWVYVKPHWFVWSTRIRVIAPPQQPPPPPPPPPPVKPSRDWGPEQACGKPDTHSAGDMPTAWASKTPDDRDEWLQLEFAKPVRPVAVLVHETYNPGALVRVTAVDDAGKETELWRGKDPTKPTEKSGISEIPVKVGLPVSRIRLHLASRRVPGWNEIDAVGMLDATGKTHWAVSATASSTYAEGPAPRVEPRKGKPKRR